MLLLFRIRNQWSRISTEYIVVMGLKQLVVAAFVLVLLQLWCCDSCLEDERLALLQLQDSFNISWFPIDMTRNCCDWDYIGCDVHTGRVNFIFISGFDRGDWYLNASMFLPFKQLAYLDLFSNGITGCLPNHGFERLTELKSLENLVLSDNNFNNNILSSLSCLSSLKVLDLSYNMLNGSINLTELSPLRNLEDLRLSGNKNVSEFVASRDVRALANLHTLELNEMTDNGMPILLKSPRAFPGLKTLYLQENNLTESTFHHETLYLDDAAVDEKFIPSLQVLSSLKSLSLRSMSIGRRHGLENLQGLCILNHLESLNLGWNNFNEELPWCLANLTSLKALDLSDNSLNGSLHSSPLGLLTHLRSLNLRGNYFDGTLPLWLANLTSLEYLDLSSNSLVGNLSSSCLIPISSIQYLDLDGNNFKIPNSLVPFYNGSNLSYLRISGNKLYEEIEWHNMIPKFQLEELYMSDNGFEGSFPKFLYSQHNLRNFDMSDNKIRGHFPCWLLDNNTRLEVLFLYNNCLTGTIKLPSHPHMQLGRLDISLNPLSGPIPEKLGSYFPSLVSLKMSNNGFDGIIPSSIGNLRQLFKLDLTDNHLSGEIPNSLFMNCLELQILKLSNNSLQGHVFPENMNLNGLMEIEMGGNQFVGSIPDSLSNCTWLSFLDFNNNNLSGEIPSWLGSMANLEILDLSRNNISGNIPTFWGASLLTQVYMSKNRLHGSFLYSFLQCSILTTLDLSHNLLTEDLARWNLSLPRLSFLVLGYNKLEGEIPSKLCSLKRLYFIDLSNNNLSGLIPSCLMYHSNWHRVYGEYSYSLRNNSSFTIVALSHPQQPLQITTKYNSLSYKGKILRLYSAIDLSHNNLSGKIPLEFGNLNQIKSLNLSHNRLTGIIPATFSNLSQIESLDLSYNKLQGDIPPQINQLPFISSFSVAYNNLSGKTPERIKQFATFDNVSYEGNSFLCGEPLSRSCTPKAPSATSERTPSNEEESGFIDMGIFYVSFKVTYAIVLSGIAAILYINPYWRRGWLYFVERKMEDCYYFAVYDCPRFFKFKA